MPAITLNPPAKMERFEVTDTSAAGVGPWLVRGTFIGYNGLAAVDITVEHTFADEMTDGATIQASLESFADSAFTAAGYISGL